MAPGDAAVEQAFSQLTRLLAPQRLRISTNLVEQFMILALDSVPRTECGFVTVWEDMRPNARRARFPLARSDRGAQKSEGKGK